MAALPRAFDRWVVLSLSLHDGLLWMEYRDDADTKRVIPSAPSPESAAWISLPLVQPVTPIPLAFTPPDREWIVDLGRRFPTMFVPADLGSLLHAGFDDFSGIARSHFKPNDVSESVPWLLPVFVSPPPGIEAAPWEHLIQAILFDQLAVPERVVVFRLAREPWTSLPPLELPLSIVDTGSAPLGWLSGVRARHWYSGSPAVREVGIRLNSPRGRGFAILPTRADIVIERSSSMSSALARWDRRLRRRRRGGPRLIVAANDGPLDQGLSRYLRTLPDGASLLLHQGAPFVPDPMIEATVTELVYTLVHDFALHEALWIIRRAWPAQYLLLATDPSANNALRLSRTMREMVDATLALTLPATGTGTFRALTAAREQVQNLAFDFTRESRGLTDMSSLLTGAIRNARAELGAAEAYETIRELAGAMPRRADIAIEEYDPFGVLTPMDEWRRKQPLLTGWRYRLRVHIGQPDRRFSAVQGTVTPIDTLLPRDAPADGYELDVVVFEKAFHLLSAGIQKLRLPRAGASKPVYFELQAPAAAGLADLRVALYLRDNLLQSFVLTAEITAFRSVEVPRDSRGVSVRLASSGTADFGNLDGLPPRRLSVALNDDVSSGTHTLMVKGGTLRESIKLTEKQLQQHMGDFRDLLQAASSAKSSSGRRLFAADPPASSDPLDAERRKEFETRLRGLARIGSGIWKMVLERPGVDTEALLALRAGKDETVQFVRHGKLLPFPWQTIYDYPLPSGAGFLNAQVCFADTPEVRPLMRGDRGCPHHPGQDFVCVEGFWAVRHRLEQIAEDESEANRVTQIDVPSGNPLVCLGIGNDDLPARTLTQKLQGKLNTDLRVLKDDDEPLGDVLWTAGTRPGLFIVLSHLEAADASMNLPARVQAVVSKSAASTHVISVTDLLDQKLNLKEWTVPRTFVLLMACESAQKHLEDLTSLIDTFFGVGAAAVAGTECEVVSDLASDFASKIVLQLIGDTKPVALGSALRAYTESMLKSRNPLPFAFSVFGSADLIVTRAKP